MKYQGKKFSVTVGSAAYRENFDRIFGVKPVDPLVLEIARQVFNPNKQQRSTAIIAALAGRFRQMIPEAQSVSKKDTRDDDK